MKDRAPLEEQAVPLAVARRRNSVIRLYDAPVYADWLAWWTAFWTVLTGLIIGFSNDPASDLPDWANGLLAAAFFGVVLGILPAGGRLMLRRWRARRRTAATDASQAQRSTGAHPGATDQPQPVASQIRADSYSAHTANTTTDAQLDGDIPEQAHPTDAQIGVAPPPSAALDAMNILSLDESQTLNDGRRELPYPAARALRSVQLARDSITQYDAVIDAGEALTVTLGITAVGWLYSVNPSIPQLARLRSAFAGPGVSQGNWLKVLQQVSSQFDSHGEPFEGCNKALGGATGLLDDLDTLREARNDRAHGARPHNAIEAGEHLLKLAPVLEDAVACASPLANATWLLVESTSLNRRRSFRVSALKVMGDHPEFERTKFTWPDALVDEDLYFQSTTTYIDLTPFAVMRFCATCRQAELCHADRIERNGLRLKSFASGHIIYDQDLAADATQLFDSTRAASSP